MMTTDHPGPIFVVGAPRSGTTLLRTMLNRHPRIGLCDETFFFYYVYARRRAFGDLTRERNRRRLAECYIATDRIRSLGLDEAALTTALVREGHSYPAFFRTLMRFFAMAHGKLHCGEKTPDHALLTETLCSWYPDCRIIHLLRDPRDVVASLVRMPWGSNSVVANARRWVRCTVGGQLCNGRENHLLVRYEQLVRQPERELTRVCGFLGESFQPVMLEAQPSTGTGKWWFERARGEITTERLEKWRDELSPSQAALVEWVAGELMKQHGFELSQEAASLPTIAAARIGEIADSLRRKLIHLPRLWYYWIQPTRIAAEEAWNDRRT